MLAVEEKHTYKVTIKNSKGRVYEYTYEKDPAHNHVTNRKPSQHHADFKYSEGKIQLSLRTKQLVLERDNYKCQSPGPHSGRLNVHHKDGSGRSDNANQSMDNLITLCSMCHMRLHYKVSDKHKTICNLYKEGFTIYQIADQYGVTKQCIQQILKRNNSTYHQIHSESKS